MAEALFFPELNRFAESEKKALKNLQNSLPDHLDLLPNRHYHLRRAIQDLRIEQITVEVKPHQRNKNWTEPVSLEFHAVLWEDRGQYHAYVPTLVIEVIAGSDEEREELLPKNIKAAIQRQGGNRSLAHLVWYQRVESLKAVKAVVEIHVKTPKKIAQELSTEPETPAVLKDVATRVSALKLPEAFEYDDYIAKLAQLLQGQHGRSVLLVGDSGVGKTAIAHQLVNQRRRFRFASTPFWETTGARLMVGADSFGDWQERCRKVVIEASKDRAIILLGNLFELAEVARHATTPRGMAGFFQPYIERGDLMVIVECTPQQRDILERDHPQLLQAFAELQVERPSPQTVASILLAVASDERVQLEAIESIERLHRRFANYSAYPGRPLRFLKELMADFPREIKAIEVARNFSRETGLPTFMIDDSLSLKLAETTEFFQQRILGQDQAIKIVIDLLASIKAGLAPPGRPIASLLFIGPTGVGKTEMAKTLAQFLFQDRSRIARFDMSEFADPIAVERLVGGRNGGQGLLTGKVREQPFGVVLFDELEKADPAFFDLLLQILGEGRLTDEAGRVADFTNSLIIMTSNLGAGSFSKGQLGFRGVDDLKKLAEQEFTRAVKQAFRPELFNRIDRLIPFAPLTLDTATEVAQIELRQIRGRSGIEDSSIALEVANEAVQNLAELGYDKRYGARPLKRALEAELLIPLAKLLSENSTKQLTVDVISTDKLLEWSIQKSDQVADADKQGQYQMANRALAARREARRIFDGRQTRSLRNRVHRMERAKNRYSKHADDSRLPEFIQILDELEDHYRASKELETKAVLGYHGMKEQDQALAELLYSQKLDLKRLTLDLYCANFDRPHKATLLLFPERGFPLRRFVQAYANLWSKKDYEFKAYKLSVGRREQKEQKDDPILRLPMGEEVEDLALWCDPQELEDCFPKNDLGIAVELTGVRVFPLMLQDSGIHAVGSQGLKSCEIQVFETDLKDYSPPAKIHLRRTLVGSKRRHYDTGQKLVHDPRLSKREPWNGKDFTKALEALLDASLEQTAREACR